MLRRSLLNSGLHDPVFWPSESPPRIHTRGPPGPGVLMEVCREAIREQLPPDLHIPSSTRFQQPQPLCSGNLEMGIPKPSVARLLAIPILCPPPGPQFTPDSHRCPEYRSPRARSGASGTHARTWRARAGSSRAGSGRWNPHGPSGHRASGLGDLFRISDTGMGGARQAPPAPGPALIPGPRRPLPRGEGHAAQERRTGELPSFPAPSQNQASEGTPPRTSG